MWLTQPPQTAIALRWIREPEALRRSQTLAMSDSLLLYLCKQSSD